MLTQDTSTLVSCSRERKSEAAQTVAGPRCPCAASIMHSFKVKSKEQAWHLWCYDYSLYKAVTPLAVLLIWIVAGYHPCTQVYKQCTSVHTHTHTQTHYPTFPPYNSKYEKCACIEHPPQTAYSGQWHNVCSGVVSSLWLALSRVLTQIAPTHSAPLVRRALPCTLQLCTSQAWKQGEMATSIKRFKCSYKHLFSIPYKVTSPSITALR